MNNAHVLSTPFVVVITGASSGIGRATAHAFAREGAHLVLAARQQADLEETARECESQGASGTLVMATDVTDARAVALLAEGALDRFGRIDVWVNNAGVVALGRFDELSPPAFRQVIETNFFGCVHGARAVLPVFRAQGRGVLINMCSMLGAVASPYASAYVSSKFAIRGFSECLRQELRDSPRIRVCTVMPVSIDTPIFHVAANYSTHRPKAIEPVYDPKVVARVVLRLARRPQREAIAGGFGRLLLLGSRLAPGLVERWVGVFGSKWQFEHDSHAAAATNGNLFFPATDGHAVEGGWRRRSMPASVKLAVATAAAALLVHALGAAGRRRAAQSHRRRQADRLQAL